MADSDALWQRLADAGFSEILVTEVTFTQTYASFDQYWDITRELAAPIAQAQATLDDAGATAIRDSVRQALWQSETADGELPIPAAAVVAGAIA